MTKRIIKPFSFYPRLLTVTSVRTYHSCSRSGNQICRLWIYQGNEPALILTVNTSCSVSARLLTLDDEVDVGDAGLVIGLEGAGVGPLVGYLHLVDVDGEVAVVAVGQRHTLVQRPLVCPREQDVRTVQPGLMGHLLVDPTSVRGQGESNR